MGQGPRKKLLYFGDNPDHVTLGLGPGLGLRLRGALPYSAEVCALVSAIIVIVNIRFFVISSAVHMMDIYVVRQFRYSLMYDSMALGKASLQNCFIA